MQAEDEGSGVASVTLSYRRVGEESFTRRAAQGEGEGEGEGEPDQVPGRSSGGCGCTTPGRASGPASWLLVLFFGAAAAARVRAR